MSCHFVLCYHRLEEFERQVFSWSFVFSARFLVQAIGKIGRHLNPLAFPLSSILNAAVRAELSALVSGFAQIVSIPQMYYFISPHVHVSLFCRIAFRSFFIVFNFNVI